MLCIAIAVKKQRISYMIKQLHIQYFHWYYNDHLLLWDKIAKEAENLAELGITTPTVLALPGKGWTNIRAPDRQW